MKPLNSFKILKTLAILITLFFSEKSFSQVDSASLCLLDMIRLKSNYTEGTDLSFNVTFFYTEKDSTGLYVTDSLNGSYKIKGNNFLSNVDSVVQVQNEQYALTIYSDEKILLIQKPDFALKTIFSKDLLDTAFLQLDVSGMTMSNYGANQKKLCVSFKTESPYQSYDMYYDTTTYLVNKIEYKLKQDTDYIKIAMAFSNYSDTPLDNSIFATTSYFTKNGNEYIPTEEYSEYELIDPLTKSWNE